MKMHTLKTGCDRPFSPPHSPLFALPALAETVTIRFVQTNDIDRMEEEDGRGGFARLAAVRRGGARRGPDALRPFRRHHLALAALRHRQGRAHHRHPEPDGRRHHGAGQPRIRLRSRDLPRAHGGGEVPDRLLQHPRGRRQPAGQHDRREDRRGRGRQDRLLRPDHRGHAGARDHRRHHVRLHASRPAAPRGRRCARRAPTSSSRWSTRRSPST